MGQKNLEKYIVTFTEVSEGDQCNGDKRRLIESPIHPTLDLLRKNHMVADGRCNYTGLPGCENCGGSRTENFQVEPYSKERADELGLVNEPGRQDNYLRTLKI